MSEKSPARRPGGRTARNRQRILEAVTQILLADGYDRLSVARVAATADVAESTIYRRWPNRAELAADALGELVQSENPMPDTGSLERDLTVLLQQVIGLLRRPEVRRLVQAAMALRDAGDGASTTTNRFWDDRFARSAVIVERAVDRGEMDARVDPYDVIEDLVGAAYFRVLVSGRPLDDALVERSVRATLQRWAPEAAAATAGLASRVNRADRK